MKNMFKKVKGAKLAVMVVALSLVMCTVIGGTVAWIVDKTAPVVNTFTYGDINITLEETTGQNYKMIPGSEITKDPTVTVKANSEACWLFVDIDESANFDTFMTYAVADGWAQLTEDAQGNDITADLIYYRAVAATTSDAAIAVIKGNKVTVKSDITKSQFEAVKNDLPTLTFTAYAVQSENIGTAKEAWAATK